MKTFHLDGFGDVPATRQQAYAFYNMVPLDDGFPARRLKDHAPPNLVPHPIYATYLIRDFLTVERSHRDGLSLEDAIRVADAAIARMTEVGDALIFYYEDNGLLNVGGRFYSGLTQARYLTALHGVSAASGLKSYARAANKVLRSLMIPAEEGGVMRHFGDGVVIEEFPHEIPNFVLNGWTTAILQVMEYAKAAQDDEAFEFAERNMVALRQMLPLFDMPELANSRYRLSGFMPHRLTGNADFHVVGGRVNVGTDTYPIHPQGEGAEKWTNRVGKATLRSVNVETVLSRSSCPEPNVVEIDVYASADMRLVYHRSLSKYDPFKSFPVKTGWEPVETHDLKAGPNTISVVVPWDTADLVGYPTNFSKKIAGPDGVKHRNVYHWLHISNLDALRKLTGASWLSPWIEKWTGYTRQWPSLEIYQHALIDFAPVGSFRPQPEEVLEAAP